MEKEHLDRRKETRDESSKVMWEALTRSQKAYDEAKKQAGMVYEAIEKHAPDKQAKDEAHKAYKEAVKQAEKVRDAIKKQAAVVFADAWEQAEKDYHDGRYVSEVRPIGSNDTHPDV